MADTVSRDNERENRDFRRLWNDRRMRSREGNFCFFFVLKLPVLEFFFFLYNQVDLNDTFGYRV